MSLAHALVTGSEFDFIRDHLIERKPPYSNMHLREACQRSGKRDIRYLHAMHASHERPNEIEGAISGPGVFWHYKLLRTKHGTQLNVLSERGSPQALGRIGRRFVKEIVNRVKEEQRGHKGHPSFTPGQFYLRRNTVGMSASHPTCVRAVKLGVLDSAFVSRLAAWQFVLLNPQAGHL